MATFVCGTYNTYMLYLRRIELDCHLEWSTSPNIVRGFTSVSSRFHITPRKVLCFIEEAGNKYLNRRRVEESEWNKGLRKEVRRVMKGRCRKEKISEKGVEMRHEPSPLHLRPLQSQHQEKSLSSTPPPSPLL